MLHNLTCAGAGVILLLATLPAAAQLTALNYRPTEAAYSRAVDRLVMIAGNPGQLHLYDPIGKTDVIVPLTLPARSLSVSSDGRFAAVGHDKAVSYFDLTTRQVVRVIETDVTVGQLLLLPQHVIIIPFNLDYYSYTPIRIARVTDVRSVPSEVLVHPGTSFDYQLAGSSDGSRFYLTRDMRVYSYRISGLTITEAVRGPEHCKGIWMTGDDRILNACGEALRSSSDTAKDLVRVGSLGGKADWVDYSAVRSEVSVAPYLPLGPSDISNRSLWVYDSKYLTKTGGWTLPSFPGVTPAIPSLARKVFYNSTGDKLIVLVEAVYPYSQEADYAVGVYSFQPACNTILSEVSATAPSAGAVLTVDVSSEAGCVWRATSSAPWVAFDAGKAGVDRKLTYFVRANPTAAARTATVTIGTKSFTVTQAGKPAVIPDFTTLPYTVVHAAYSKGLDRLVVVSTGPNELHLYNGATAEELVTVPLSLAPRVIAISPNGSMAAVGHDGWISRVNLVSGVLEAEFPVTFDVKDLTLTATHAFSGMGWLRSVDMSTGAEIDAAPGIGVGGTFLAGDTSLIGFGQVAELQYPGRQRFRIVGGTAALEKADARSSCMVKWGSVDSLRGYSVCGEAIKLDPSAADDLSVTAKFAEYLRSITDVPSRGAAFALVTPSGSYSNVYRVTRFRRDTLVQESEFPLPVVPEATGLWDHPYLVGEYIFADRAGDRLAVLGNTYLSSQVRWHIASSRTDSPPGCQYSVGPPTITISPSGDDRPEIKVITQYGCPVSATTTASWLSVSVVGNRIDIRAGRNSGAATRTATVTVADKTLSIVQPGECYYVLSGGAYFPSEGGSSVFNISTGEGCPWALTITRGDWFTVSPKSGTGSGTFTVTAGATPGPYRNGTISTPARDLDVNQRGMPDACSIRAEWLLSHSDTGGSGTTPLTVTGDCRDGFRILSSPPWLQIYPLSSPTVPSTVSYTVYPNFSTKSRFGHLELSTGERHSISQAYSLYTYEYRLVGHLYFASFGRKGAGGELYFQVNEGLGKGLTAADLAANFLNSQEFNDGGRFIAGLYVGLLNRNAEYGGWLFQRNALTTGKASPQQLVLNFINSAEWKNKYGTPTDAEFVRILYRQILLREPSTGEVDFQAGALGRGTPRADLAAAFLNAPEFRRGTGPRLTAFLLYATLLSREPNATELAATMAAVQGGSTIRQIAEQLLTGAEFKTIVD